MEQAQRFIDCQFAEEVGPYKPAEPDRVREHGEGLRAAYEALLQLAQTRRERLEESRQMWQFLWEMADEEQWMKEKGQLMSSPDLGHDLASVLRLLNKHKALKEELSVSPFLIFLPLDSLIVVAKLQSGERIVY